MDKRKENMLLNNLPKTKKCELCGKEFLPVFGEHQRYCGKTCAMAFARSFAYKDHKKIFEDKFKEDKKIKERSKIETKN